MPEYIDKASLIELIQTKLDALKEAKERCLVIPQTPIEAKETILQTILDQLMYLPVYDPKPKPLEELLDEPWIVVNKSSGCVFYLVSIDYILKWDTDINKAMKFYDGKAPFKSDLDLSAFFGFRWVKFPKESLDQSNHPG